MNLIWALWGIGFGTGAGVAYLGCILFCRQILKQEGQLIAFFEKKKAAQIDESALNSFLKEWERQMERRKYGTDQ